MNEKDLFGLALGLVEPWYIERIEFDVANKRLDLFLDFKRGSRFPCPECGGLSPVHDTTERTWRHLDFFQHQAYLTARVPRTNCPRCGVKQVAVSWARPGSGFTLLFEALVLYLAREMPVTSAAELASVNQMSVWRILEHYVEQAVKAADLSGLKAVGIDECSKQKGHKYITTFCDLDKARVVYVAEGRGSDTLEAFAGHLEDKGLKTKQVEEVCCDMWPAYLSGIEVNLPEAAVTFDRYHVMAKMNKAVDEVRRQEAKEELLLKETRYLWLKNPEDLTRKQRRKLNSVKEQDLKTVRAYHIKLALQRFWEFRYPAAASRYLKKWYFWATHSRLEPVVEVAKLIKRHEEGILRFLKSRITNGVVEGLNSKIKTALKRAYGFKSFSYYRTIIYLVAGKLSLPTQC
jgi:transposase